MRRLALLIALSLALFVSACSRPPAIIVFNATNVRIEIVRVLVAGRPSGDPPGLKAWSWLWTWRFLIDPGAERAVGYSLYQEFEVELRSDGCRHDTVPWPHNATDDISLRLMPDHRLYWTNPGPNDRTVVSVDESGQPEGFPIFEDSDGCERS